MYFPSGDAIFHHTGSTCSLRGYRADLTWKEGENDALSDDSDVDIIENSPVQKNQDLCPKDNDMEPKEVELDKKHVLEDSNSMGESDEMEMIENCDEVAELDLHTLSQDFDL